VRPDPPAAELEPLTTDLGLAVPLLTAGIVEACRHTKPPEDPAPRIDQAVKFLRSGRIEGRLYRIRGETSGIAVWESGSQAGLHVVLLYLRAPTNSADDYRELLRRIHAECGPIALLPGHLFGLAPSVEAALMDGLGFAPFGRSEMRLPPTAPLPSAPPPPGGVRIRNVRPDDEPELARVHAAAFGTTFDYYLFQADPDPVRDSAIGVRDMVSGRYGEFLTWASYVAEAPDGTLQGGCLFVRAPTGPLLVSVFVDPAAHGTGLGRALVVASVAALRGRGESVIALNVTEGNRRAIALYERLGFVRSLGPDMGWYSRDRIPVAPDA